MQITASDLLERLSGFPVRTFASGETILHAGSASGHLLFLKQGAVDVLIEEDRLTRIAEPGAVLGELSFLLQRPHTADVVAVQPSSCYVVDNPEALFEAEPAVGLYLATVLAQRLNVVNHLLIDTRRRVVQTDQPPGLLTETLGRIGRALHLGSPG